PRTSSLPVTTTIARGRAVNDRSAAGACGARRGDEDAQVLPRGQRDVAPAQRDVDAGGVADEEPEAAAGELLHIAAAERSAQHEPAALRVPDLEVRALLHAAQDEHRLVRDVLVRDGRRRAARRVAAPELPREDDERRQRSD